MANRKAAEATCLKLLEKYCPGNPNVGIYAERFKIMSDKEFASMMQGIADDTFILPYIEPNQSKYPRVSIKSNLKFLHDMGYDPYQRIWMKNPDGSRTLSNFKYLILPMPVRRQAQHLVKKISIPSHNRTVDEFTGQPRGDSKGSKISYPEIGVLDSLGLKDSLEEMLIYRGGDNKGFTAMNSKVIDTGTVSFAEIQGSRSGVESVKILSALLKAAHIGNNLNSGPT